MSLNPIDVLPLLNSQMSSKSKSSEDTLARQSDVIVSSRTPAFSEYNGFFISVLSSTALFCFIGWCLIPTSFFENYLNFDYFPDKYWCVAVPAYTLALMLYIYIALALYNTEVLTLKLNDVRNFVDEYTIVPGRKKPFEGQNTELLEYIHKAPSGVWDLPVTLVNEVLYNEHDSDEEEVE